MTFNALRVAKRAPERFEERFGDVMVVLSLRLHVERDPHRLREGAEEVLDHFGREVAHELVFELRLEGEPGTAGDVERNPAEGLIHGKEEPEAADAALVA